MTLHTAQLIGCAEGLSYLHSRKVVHGDLKCQNVLISASGEGEPIPLICDFGASRIIGVSGYTTQAIWGTQGFLAPELFDEPDVAKVVPTFQSDVWAFGVMVYVSSTCNIYSHSFFRVARFSNSTRAVNKFRADWSLTQACVVRTMLVT